MSCRRDASAARPLSLVVVEVVEGRLPPGIGRKLLVVFVAEAVLERVALLAALAERFEAPGLPKFVRMLLADSLLCFHG